MVKVLLSIIVKPTILEEKRKAAVMLKIELSDENKWCVLMTFYWICC